jgi:hypothetical protein
MSKADPFGFSTADRVAAKIAEIKPEPEKSSQAALAALDRVAEQHGFRSREPVEGKIVRRRREVGPSAQLNVKCPVPTYNRFIRFCDEERLPYWEGIEKLLDLAGVSQSGKRDR